MEWFKPALDKLTPRARIMYPGNQHPATVQVQYLEQYFKIHARKATGEIESMARSEIGPSYKGFVLKGTYQTRGSNQAVVPRTVDELYWKTEIDVTPLADTGIEISWSLSYGTHTDEKILEGIRKTLKAIKGDSENSKK